jgi:NAD(P)-dependent dehydrogenase (short-subunit alcohol dehydrogenase family)
VSDESGTAPTRLDGRVAIVTGAAGGIGSVTCRVLAEAGARVVAADVELDGAEAVAHDLGDAVTAAHVDLASPESLKKMIDGVMQSHGRIDVLDNNAAFVHEDIFARDGVVADADPEVLDAIYAVNLRGTTMASSYAIPHMIAGGGGVIINIATSAAVLSDNTHLAYALTKAAVIALTQAIATHHGRQGIRSVAISPGMMATERLRKNQPPEKIEMILRHHLTPYPGAPEDIAHLVAFLASDAAKYITGINILCDGGLTAHQPAYADLLQLSQG